MEFIDAGNETRDEAAILELLQADLEPFYLPRLPYHNWDEHIQNGLSIVSNLTEAEKAKGNPVNSSMALAAYMGHDAGFSHDLGHQKGGEAWHCHASPPF